MIKTACLSFTFLLMVGCAAPAKERVRYPRKPADTEGRKAGPAMLLYEQAEEDLDPNNDVIVIPPPDKKES